jgi:hypothetical protein
MTNEAQTSQPDLHLSPICWSRLGHNLANQVNVVRNGAEAIDYLITCAVPGQSPLDAAAKAAGTARIRPDHPDDDPDADDSAR